MRNIVDFLLMILSKIFPFAISSKKSLIGSSIVLILANCMPVLGVILFKWSIFVVLIIYWAESAIVGFYNIFRMLIAGAIGSGKFSIFGLLGSIFLSAFFTVHFGGFMAGHLIFLLVFGVMFFKENVPVFGSDMSFTPENIPVFFHNYINNTFSSPLNFIESSLFAIIILFASYSYAFFLHFIKEKEFVGKSSDFYFSKPYSRIIVMHLTIIFGGFLLMFFGKSNIGLMTVWIILKIFIDLRSHYKAHTDNANYKKLNKYEKVNVVK